MREKRGPCGHWRNKGAEWSMLAFYLNYRLNLLNFEPRNGLFSQNVHCFDIWKANSALRMTSFKSIYSWKFLSIRLERHAAWSTKRPSWRRQRSARFTSHLQLINQLTEPSPKSLHFKFHFMAKPKIASNKLEWLSWLQRSPLTVTPSGHGKSVTVSL